MLAPRADDSAGYRVRLVDLWKLTEHMNRFGLYTLKRDRVPEPLDGVRVLWMPTRSEGVERAAKALCDNPT